ncbi:MAG TPA: GNAT family N-acetyltransferase [Phycisphaerae bacterium]|jgi:CelD/BcsL family acetyltransferase involved in cellulose biosynthesis|nr:GNAT family N-acetyltransferase [Phycisphaerae bacterium]HOB74535.1 GNAT family N-acetyltransferase [Phycisphaerae bacterium]HOJ54195.1 GNAT family N-acetyltransferase [Phycisphaerae bacterium]HOL26614.1 GNAT family N-acetyltransferase [Phycisphaerae bacterium]HPP20348.1 GNAT family N-acetyltransferase [Phycisphaerae bacterium]
MRVEVIQDRTGLEALASEWNPLLAGSRADNVFLTWEFISTWLDVVRPTCDLYVLVVRDDDGACLGIAPFYRRRLKVARTFSLRCLRVLGDDAAAADYPDLIIRSDLESEVLEALGRHLAASPGWDCLWLARTAGWTGALNRLGQLSAGGGFHLRCRTRPFSRVHLPDNYEAYLEKLSGKTRYNLRRGRRQCESLGGCKLRVCEDPGQVASFVGELVRLHQKHWEAAGDAGAFRRNPCLRTFFEEVAGRFLRCGWLRLAGLEVDGRIRAVQFGYAYHGVYSAIQEGYDPDLTEVTCGVGNVARAATIEATIAEGLGVYDFLDGATWHKQRWGADLLEGYDIFIHRRSLRTLPLRVGEIWPTGRFMTWDGQ